MFSKSFNATENSIFLETAYFSVCNGRKMRSIRASIVHIMKVMWPKKEN